MHILNKLFKYELIINTHIFLFEIIEKNKPSLF